MLVNHALLKNRVGSASANSKTFETLKQVQGDKLW